MDKNDNKFLLYVIIALLASIIVFSATFLIPIKSGVLQYISGGVMIVSIMILVFFGIEKVKNNMDDKKINNEISEIQKQTRSIIDAPFYQNAVGKYHNQGSICLRKKTNASYNLDNIYKAIKKYSYNSNVDNFILFFRTNALLGKNEEIEIRQIVSKCNSKIAILKDISSFNLPDGVYDVNTLIIKTDINHLQDIFNFFSNNKLSVINICDDYNPDIFSERDKAIAMNENYNFKLFFDSKSNSCNIYMRYGLIENVEKFVDGILQKIL